MKSKKIILFKCVVILFLFYDSFYSQSNEEKIKHIIYSNRLLKRSSMYLNLFNEMKGEQSGIFPNLYPKYGEYYWIDLIRLDTITLNGFDVYEYRVREKCNSELDEEWNKLHYDNPDLYFVDGVYKPCICCSSTGNAFEDHIPYLEGCGRTSGIIVVDYPNNEYSPRVYFLSGKCMYVEAFEVTFFKTHELNFENIKKILQLKFWESNSYKSGTRLLKIVPLRRNKFRIYLKESQQKIIMKVRRNNFFKIKTL